MQPQQPQYAQQPQYQQPAPTGIKKNILTTVGSQVGLFVIGAFIGSMITLFFMLIVLAR